MPKNQIVVSLYYMSAKIICHFRLFLVILQKVIVIFLKSDMSMLTCPPHTSSQIHPPIETMPSKLQYPHKIRLVNKSTI
ncbi:hypothetical protein [Moraxella lacunata]|uniref:hypothetical protein n=1 Tax=Moraxella lacunata TaxID=477 RepID=UPI003EE2E45F